jgi:hypothetical protein
MAIITITEAAKKWNCGRATIYRKLSAGALSETEMPDGGRGIDTSEMLRVFGPADSPDVQPDVLDKGAGRDLIRENAHLLQLLEAKDQHIESLRQALRLIEHRSAVGPAMEEPPVPAALVESSVQRADSAVSLEAERARVTELEVQLAAERSRGFFSRVFGGKR